MKLNSVIIHGHLCRDPEAKNRDGTLATCTVALNEYSRDGERASFIEVKSFNKAADFLLGNFRQGDPILVIGRLRQDRWESDGQKFSKVVVVADRFDFGGFKADRENGNKGRQRDETSQASNQGNQGRQFRRNPREQGRQRDEADYERY